MMQFEGDKEFPQSLPTVWAKLSDARFLVQCIPGSESVKEAEEKKAVCVLRPGFAFVRGTLEVTLQIVEAVTDKSVKLALQSKGIGSSSDVEALLTLEPKDAGTKLHWNAEVKRLGGLLKAVPKGLIRGAAQKVITDVWAAVETRLASA
jgi:carbon monoxide dehydrogenase subunit G